MLRIFEKQEGLDLGALSALYRGSALENCCRMYPGEPTAALALARYEREHAQYMTGEFFAHLGCRFAVEEEKGVYFSGLKLYPYGDGANTFLIEALETHPDFRGQGWGSRILEETIAWLEEHLGPVTLAAFVHRENTASIRTHLHCGFRQERDYWQEPDGTVDQENVTMCYRTGR